MSKAESLRQAALDYHEKPSPGKLGINITKPFTTDRELSLAYSPGVAAPVIEINKDADAAFRYTSRGNLVACITDGTAVLGLGNMGALAAKPVMEGKAVLFKKFGGVDVFDIEVEAENTKAFIDTVAHIAPTFGGINLEDIAAPACFEIEEALIERLDIPVFHDDQHGTAIIVCAGLMNALELQGKKLEDANVTVLGAGAAGIASVRLLLAMGADKNKIAVLDRQGVIHTERENLTDRKRSVAIKTDKRTLTDAMEGCDVFIGLSGPNLVTGDMVSSMAANPVVFALSNPDPEIDPEIVNSLRDDVIMATGRSDYPNQVNNVLCFPFLFRGALDVRARRITQEMHVAAVDAIRGIAKEPVPQSVLDAYDSESMEFGPQYIIPTPLDPRLIDRIPGAVAAAAIDSGVARVEYPAHYPERPNTNKLAAA